MQDIFNYHGLGPIILFIIISVFVKTNNAAPRVLFFSSLFLIVIAVLHVHFSSVTEGLAEVLRESGHIASAEEKDAKAVIALWNAAIALIVGGVGVSMFNTWLTTQAKDK